MHRNRAQKCCLIIALLFETMACAKEPDDVPEPYSYFGIPLRRTELINSLRTYPNPDIRFRIAFMKATCDQNCFERVVEMTGAEVLNIPNMDFKKRTSGSVVPNIIPTWWNPTNVKAPVYGTWLTPTKHSFKHVNAYFQKQQEFLFVFIEDSDVLGLEHHSDKCYCIDS
jgi:hypothetical protein